MVSVCRSNKSLLGLLAAMFDWRAGGEKTLLGDSGTSWMFSRCCGKCVFVCWLLVLWSRWRKREHLLTSAVMLMWSDFFLWFEQCSDGPSVSPVIVNMGVPWEEVDIPVDGRAYGSTWNSIKFPISTPGSSLICLLLQGSLYMNSGNGSSKYSM